jgi:predicted SprT family Zn-dependent metalloprotease
MIVSEAVELATNLMREHGINWSLELDNAKRRFGRCSYCKQTISLSSPLIELNNEEVVRNTILHEIAHAKAGPNTHHGQKWIEIARSIGCNGKRCYNDEVITPEPKWIGSCPNGHEINRLRKPNGRRSCCRCGGGKFNEQYLITWYRK